MYYVKVGGRRWKVREAISLKAALDCIAHARVTGSVGGKDVVTNALPDRPYGEWPSKVLADVVQVNSDLTERQPYSEAY